MQRQPHIAPPEGFVILDPEDMGQHVKLLSRIHIVYLESTRLSWADAGKSPRTYDGTVNEYAGDALVAIPEADYTRIFGKTVAPLKAVKTKWPHWDAVIHEQSKPR